MLSYEKQLSQREVTELATTDPGTYICVIWPGDRKAKVPYRLRLDHGIPVAIAERQNVNVIAGHLDKLEPKFGNTQDYEPAKVLL